MVDLHLVSPVLSAATREALFAELSERNPDAALIEPREHFDIALSGITDMPEDRWTRAERVWVAVYDTQGCIESIMRWLSCDAGTAEEWFGFNTAGAWVGPGTWTFTRTEEDEEE